MKIELPAIGFGTWKFKNNSETTAILCHAVECGYTLIDTASAYQNEEAIGEAIAKQDRSNLFLSGKLWNADRDHVETACDQTIKNLRCGYLDLYLMHWPASKALYDNWSEINDRVWADMERLVVVNKVRNIGVSNFKVSQLKPLLENCRIKPLVNQIEFHPGFTQQETVNYCHTNGILVQAWSPLRSGKALKRKEIIEIAEKYQKTPAQIILRWCIQNSVIPIVKSSDPERMKSNLCLDFTLSNDDVQYLNNLPDAGFSGLDSETLTLFG